MLYAPNKPGEAIRDVPRSRREQYRAWRGRLSQTQYDAIASHLNEQIGEAPIHTAGWMPGEKWDGTVFEPILSVACRGNRDAAGKCFGLILWELMIRREEDWSFGRFEHRDGVPIESMTYFRI